MEVRSTCAAKKERWTMFKLIRVAFVSCVLSLGVAQTHGATLSTTAVLYDPAAGSNQLIPVCSDAYFVWQATGAANEQVSLGWWGKIAIDSPSGPSDQWGNLGQTFNLGPSGTWSRSETDSNWYTVSGTTHTATASSKVYSFSTGNGPGDHDGPRTFFTY